jgi:Protein of unknown function (DUF4242)
MPRPAVSSIEAVNAGFYLVERYVPGATPADLAAAAARVAAAAAELSADGIRVRYLGSSFVPDEETCFCEFEAASSQAVEWANERAGVAFAQILPAVRLSAAPTRRRSSS